ncbi:MAG: acyl carrier protein, partial [Rhodospirillales bacterium]|nr:acyl carrier protein [Rhodospirillales bacterium]
MGTTDHAIIENNIYEFLKDLFKDLFKMQEIEVRPELSAKDVVGWDSFKQVEITLALEEEFGVIIR